MIREVVRVAWYRLRLDLPRRWSSYAGIVLLVALIGGIALGSIAGARRSESAFPTFLKGTNPSDLAIDVGLYNPKILKEIARLPQVTSIETYVSPNAAPVTAAGLVNTRSPLFNSNFDPIASLNGLYFNQDRVTILQGTRPDPRRPDEAMVNEFASKLYGWHVGSVVRFGFFTNAQLGQNGFPTSSVHPRRQCADHRHRCRQHRGRAGPNRHGPQYDPDPRPDASPGALLHLLRVEWAHAAPWRGGRSGGRVELPAPAASRIPLLLPCDVGD